MEPYKGQDLADEQKNPGNQKEENPGPLRDSSLVAGMKYVHIGFILPAATIGGWAIGALLDGWLHTKKLGLAGLGLGIVAGFYELIRTVIKMSKEG